MNTPKRGNGIVNPEEAPKDKTKKKIKRNPTELIERDEEQVLTEDGRQLLKD